MAGAREKSFQCFQCDKKFHQQSQLIVHIRHHTGEKPFVCTYCSKGFASVKVLKVHERVHTGERPYKCPYCEKSFSAYANLVVHRRIHTNEKPYICKLCCRGFEHSGNLSRHFKAHMVDTGFRCILCGKIFELEEDLLEHTKTEHHNEYETYTSSDKSSLDRLLPLLDSNEAEIAGGISRDSDDVKSSGDIKATTKERLITKINKREMRIISPKCPKEISPRKSKVQRRETEPYITHLSDSSLSPPTDNFNISEESERGWKPDSIDLESSDSQYANNYPMDYVPKKLLKLKIRDDHLLTENKYYRNYKTSFSSSSSNHGELHSNNDSCNTNFSDSLDCFNRTSPSSPHPIILQNNESPYRCYNPYEVEVQQEMNHSSTAICHSRSPRDIDPHSYQEDSSFQPNSKTCLSAPPPLIPIEDMDHSCDMSPEPPSLENFRHQSHRSINRFDSSDLRNSLDECDIYSEPVKSELNDKYMLHRRPKEEDDDFFNYRTNGVLEINDKSIVLPELPDKQREAFRKKVERTLRTLVGKNVMKHFGFPERTCEQVLICILDMANKSPCADVRVNETDRMKINMRKLIECSFPTKNSWEMLGWTGKTIEFILDEIEAQENVLRGGSKGGVGFGTSSSSVASDDYFTKVQGIKSETFLSYKTEQ